MFHALKKENYLEKKYVSFKTKIELKSEKCTILICEVVQMIRYWYKIITQLFTSSTRKTSFAEAEKPIAISSFKTSSAIQTGLAFASWNNLLNLK